MSLNWEKISFLIAEDEPDLREVMVNVFEAQGCQVHSAADGFEALEVLKKTRIDVIISDVRMPRCDGVQLLDSIQKLELKDKPLIFLVTGYADISESEAIKKGASRLLHKPFNIPDILALVEKKLTEKSESR